MGIWIWVYGYGYREEKERNECRFCCRQEATAPKVVFWTPRSLEPLLDENQNGGAVAPVAA